MNARIYFNKRLTNDGRNFNFNTSFSKGKNNNELLSNFERSYFLNAIDSIVHFDQIRTQFNNNQNFNFSAGRSEEHTSELQSRGHLVCRLLLEKKNSMNGM